MSLDSGQSYSHLKEKHKTGNVKRPPKKFASILLLKSSPTNVSLPITDSTVISTQTVSVLTAPFAGSNRTYGTFPRNRWIYMREQYTPWPIRTVNLCSVTMSRARPRSWSSSVYVRFNCASRSERWHGAAESSVRANSSNAVRSKDIAEQATDFPAGRPRHGFGTAPPTGRRSRRIQSARRVPFDSQVGQVLDGLRKEAGGESLAPVSRR